MYSSSEQEPRRKEKTLRLTHACVSAARHLCHTELLGTPDRALCPAFKAQRPSERSESGSAPRWESERHRNTRTDCTHGCRHIGHSARSSRTARAQPVHTHRWPQGTKRCERGASRQTTQRVCACGGRRCGVGRRVGFVPFRRGTHGPTLHTWLQRRAAQLRKPHQLAQHSVSLSV